VATPKQIRELMKVDGLTNDEVKSHLQVNYNLINLPFMIITR
jgi:SHAQKYF class myb-like DNA-binding protein